MKYAICLPTVKSGLDGGGYMHMISFKQQLEKIAETIFVSYRKREEEIFFLPEHANQLKQAGYTLVLAWGPDVAGIVKEYGGRMNIVYYMKGRDWGVELTPDIPIIANCKYLLGYAEKNWPGNPKFYLPELLESSCVNQNVARDIDVLVIARKQTSYVLKKLLPELKKSFSVHVQKEYIERKELYSLYNRSKVYLYTFNPMETWSHYSGWRLMEGSATQVLEAIGFGCVVASNLRGGMIDYFEPQVNGFLIEKYSKQWDLLQVQKALNFFGSNEHLDHQEFVRKKYGISAYQNSLQQLHKFLTEYFEFKSAHAASIGDFSFPIQKSLKQKLKAKAYRWKKKIVR